jgi:hypothetical protein
VSWAIRPFVATFSASWRTARTSKGTPSTLVSYNHDPEELRGELVAAGLADVLVLGIEGPLGAQARLDVSLADTAISAARIAEVRAPHFSIHLLARGIKKAGQ